MNTEPNVSRPRPYPATLKPSPDQQLTAALARIEKLEAKVGELTELPFPDFGKWLTYHEAIKSDTAIRKGITNVPTLVQYQNMKVVYDRFYAPACEHFGRKLPVSSFFRSAALNRAIGGASGSAHMYGCAIDIDCDGIGTPTNRQLFDWLRQSVVSDQLILEAPDKYGNPSWVHVAINRNGEADRRQVLRMTRDKNGKATYQNV